MAIRYLVPVAVVLAAGISWAGETQSERTGNVQVTMQVPGTASAPRGSGKDGKTDGTGGHGQVMPSGVSGPMLISPCWAGLCATSHQLAAARGTGR